MRFKTILAIIGVMALTALTVQTTAAADQQPAGYREWEMTWQVDYVGYGDCPFAELGIAVGDVYSATIAYRMPFVPGSGAWTSWSPIGDEFPAFGELGDFTWSKALPDVWSTARVANNPNSQGYDLFESFVYFEPLPGMADSHPQFFYQLYDGTATNVEPGVPVTSLDLQDWSSGSVYVWFDEIGSFGECWVYGTILSLTATTTTVPGLIDQVEALNLDIGVSNSLVAKLQSAADALDKGNDGAAVNKLEAFIYQVEAQAGNKIPQTDADALIAWAQQILDLLTG